MAIKDVLVPNLGDFKDVPVIDIMVNVGDTVELDTPLMALESDKATMDVPSPAAGLIKEIVAQVGDTVSQGTLLLKMDTDVAPADEQPAPPPPKKEIPATPAQTPTPQEVSPPPRSSDGDVTRATLREPKNLPDPPVQQVDEQAFAKAHATPSVRRFARELGVDLGKVTGTGRKGRILKEDVQKYVKQVVTEGANVPLMATSGVQAGMGIPEIPEIDFSQFGEVETVPLQRIKKISGAALHRNWLNVPHVTQFDEADITELETFRKELKAEAEKRGVRMTMLAFLMKACSAALQRFPDFNASLDSSKENLVLKKYIHIGFAADTPQGLVVPVIRDVDQKGLFEIAEELGILSQKAREGKLTPSEMQGGCFTISSLGGIGGTQFTPIVNAPEVAILGVSRAKMQPVYQNDTFVPRLMLPLALSYDHRVVDGAAGARFTTYINFLLSDVRRLLL